MWFCKSRIFLPYFAVFRKMFCDRIIWKDCIYKCFKTVKANALYFTCFFTLFWKKKSITVGNFWVVLTCFDKERASNQWFVAFLTKMRASYNPSPSICLYFRNITKHYGKSKPNLLGNCDNSKIMLC